MKTETLPFDLVIYRKATVLDNVKLGPGMYGKDWVTKFRPNTTPAVVLDRTELAHATVEKALASKNRPHELGENHVRNAAAGSEATLFVLDLPRKFDIAQRKNKNAHVDSGAYYAHLSVEETAATPGALDAAKEYVHDVLALARAEYPARKAEADAYDASAAGKLDVALDALDALNGQHLEQVAQTRIIAAIRAAVAAAVEEATKSTKSTKSTRGEK